jgi:hypothetical protein
MGNAPENTVPQPDYLSYLLRLWRMQGDAAAWRGSLESPHTGERRGFGSLDELFSFLREQTSAMSDNKCGDSEEVQDEQI